MSHGVKKDTFVNANEETTKSLTFDLLDNLYNKVAEAVEIQKVQVEVCGKRFIKIENNKKKDTGVAAASGFGGGFIAMAVYYVRNWITG
jgi:hypothetical protein